MMNPPVGVGERCFGLGTLFYRRTVFASSTMFVDEYIVRRLRTLFVRGYGEKLTTVGDEERSADDDRSG
jgi:hypothetical protein